MKKKYKVMAWIMAALGAALILVELILEKKAGAEAIAKSIAVIGGSDGPTSIFIAGKIGVMSWFPAVGAVLLVGAVVVWFILRKKK